MLQRFYPILICLALLSGGYQSALAAPSEPGIAAVQSLIEIEEYRQAETQIRQLLDKQPKNQPLLTIYARLLESQGRLGEAEQTARQGLNLGADAELSNLLNKISTRLDKYASSQNQAGVRADKYIGEGDYQTAIAIANRAIAQWPDKDIFYQFKGEALYKANDLEQAEVTLRKALQINPLNAVAKSYVEEIRTTNQAQTSEELAEWISIAKDKVGDFVVTFLALFAAFVVNSLIAPLTLRIKLNRARRSFEQGDYDEFTDLIEGLLDLENFGPIRSNFQFVLKHKSLEEAQEILNKYVNTLERLPTLLRILEREHERLNETN